MPPFPNDTPSAPDATVASPCTGVCRIEPKRRVCEGCFRTLDEIASWGELDEPARRALLDELRRRRSRMPEDRPGAAGAEATAPDAAAPDHARRSGGGIE